MLTDGNGLLVAAIARAACVQDRGAPALLVSERAAACLDRNRRPAKNFEATIEDAGMAIADPIPGQTFSRTLNKACVVASSEPGPVQDWNPRRAWDILPAPRNW